MSLYCERCMKLYDAQLCPKCRPKRPLREPRPDDAVFLTEKSSLWAGALAQALADNGISCLQKGALGAAMRTYLGEGSEVFSFYVPYSELEIAGDVVEAMFPNDGKG